MCDCGHERLRRLVGPHVSSLRAQHSRPCVAHVVHTRRTERRKGRRQRETITDEATILFLYGASLFFLRTLHEKRVDRSISAWCSSGTLVLVLEIIQCVWCARARTCVSLFPDRFEFRLCLRDIHVSVRHGSTV